MAATRVTLGVLGGLLVVLCLVLLVRWGLAQTGGEAGGRAVDIEAGAAGDDGAGETRSPTSVARPARVGGAGPLYEHPSSFADVQRAYRSLWVDSLSLDEDGDGLLTTDAERQAAVDHYLGVMRPDHPVFIAMGDLDGDGVVSAEEGRAAAARESEWAWARFGAGRFDADGDGFVSDSERAEAEAVLGPVRERMTQLPLDADGDGRVSDAELGFALMLDPESDLMSLIDRNPLPRGRVSDEGERIAYDMDGDGEVTAADHEAMSADQTVMRRRAVLRDVINWEAYRRVRFDTDGDGRVSEGEDRAGRAAYIDELTRRRLVAEHDADGDRVIGPAEIERFRGWVRSGSPRGDLDLDGETTGADLALFLRLVGSGG